MKLKLDDNETGDEQSNRFWELFDKVDKMIDFNGENWIRSYNKGDDLKVLTAFTHPDTFSDLDAEKATRFAQSLCEWLMWAIKKRSPDNWNLIKTLRPGESSEKEWKEMVSKLSKKASDSLLRDYLLIRRLSATKYT
jgi:hypothetical protein